MRALLCAIVRASFDVLTFSCDRKCQVAAWPAHKKFCSAQGVVKADTLKSIAGIQALDRPCEACARDSRKLADMIMMPK